ncbi:MAG: nicotinate-nucleotide adenylyltransferase [Thermodesulfobacteriota bacterium]
MKREAGGVKLRAQGTRFKVQGLKNDPSPLVSLPQRLSQIGDTGHLTPNPEPRIPNPKRIGLFGGTFNPIHLGHLRAGIEIREAFSLDRVLFIPTAIPPHKKTRNLLPFAHRLKMVRLAIAGYPFFKASDVEKKRKGKSYSIQTLRFFKRTYGSKAELYFIVGMDAFLEINTWKNYQDLFALSHFVVMDRPGYRRSHVKEFLQQEISPEIIFYPRENRFLLPWGFSVFLFPITLMDISSTRIRTLRQKKQSVRYLLPYEVEDYMEEKNFYAN